MADYKNASLRIPCIYYYPERRISRVYTAQTIHIPYIEFPVTFMSDAVTASSRCNVPPTGGMRLLKR